MSDAISDSLTELPRQSSLGLAAPATSVGHLGNVFMGSENAFTKLS
jgi:hypothetical protein